MMGLIWAQSRTGVIGRDGTIPWQLPEDLAHFRALTTGCTVVMGRRTWESLPEAVRPLPKRRNIVITRNAGYTAAGAQVVGDLESVITEPDSWVIGGADIYALALPRATRCEVTEVDAAITAEPGDVLAPVLDASWRAQAGGWQTSRTGLRYRFVSYRRA
ncbi:dihydrofolate reductase [Mycolicibacillus parakoreensis]|uniref:Dihydrofolate reductase n=2 Tax=Mycolicibacillus parakoreensis TaxID=1069221 RepID=A0ABY3TV81_9MYCO|nr:dihydrofolate reductase [Mycolicibacillus parakoreensis]ULN51618.1 dihydrofolate reductase [Mycolicibacillus parakoreensis]